jgi:hypothetical protein
VQWVAEVDLRRFPGLDETRIALRLVDSTMISVAEFEYRPGLRQARHAHATHTVSLILRGGLRAVHLECTVPIVNSDDGALVSNFGFAIDSPVGAGVWTPYWYVDGATIVTHDLLSSQTLRANVLRDASDS